MTWRWVDRRALLLLHGESLAEHGGAPGMRDDGLLDSALARPVNLAAYGTPDIADLAASYGIGIARNHPFVDGNKRAALLATGLFLALNDYRLTATQADTTLTIIAIADATLDEAGFAQWLRRHTARTRGAPLNRVPPDQRPSRNPSAPTIFAQRATSPAR